VDHFRSAGLTFPVRDAGPADGEAVVLLHGFPQNRSSWDDVIPLLAEAGYRVLAPDQRGYAPGALPKGRRNYAMPHLLDDVIALLDQAGLEKAHLVGHDWGGGIAWSLAAKAPDRLQSLTVLSTPHPAAMRRAAVTGTQGIRSRYMLFFQLPRLPEKVLDPATPSGRRRFLRSLRRSGLDPEASERAADVMATPGVLTGALNCYRGLPFSGRIAGGVAAPTLYIWGKHDAFLGRKAALLTADYVTGPYQFREIDAGHWIQNQAVTPLLDHLAANKT
jgi:pimeloyl-ACP methyl ester carboxylesterase